MIEMHSKYDNMHTNRIFNTLNYINNNVNSCINCMLSVGYLRRISNYLKKIALFDPTHMKSMIDALAIILETLRIYNRCSLEKAFIELIYMNP